MCLFIVLVWENKSAKLTSSKCNCSCLSGNKESFVVFNWFNLFYLFCSDFSPSLQKVYGSPFLIKNWMIWCHLNEWVICENNSPKLSQFRCSLVCYDFWETLFCEYIISWLNCANWDLKMVPIIKFDDCCFFWKASCWTCSNTDSHANWVSHRT